MIHPFQRLLLVLLLDLSACATVGSPPDCGYACCLPVPSDDGGMSGSVQCDGTVVEDPELGTACRRLDDDVIESCL